MSNFLAIDWEALASNGHAPASGCSLLGVGYEDAFDQLTSHYVEDRFSRGLSSEKFVIGPFGSGKTHFLRQMSEMAAARDCVVSEVKLNKDIDFTKRLVLYQEIVREIKAPDQSDHGVPGLVRAMLANVTSQAPDEAREEVVDAWITGIGSADLKLDAYGRVAQVAFRAALAEDDPQFLAATRWLEGELADPQLRKVLPVGAVPADSQNRWAGQMLLSLFQLIKHAGYRGTVVGLDEAEQGFAVDHRRLNRILSMLKSDVDSIADLEGGAVLVLYALTPDIRQEMFEFPALQQRLADPGGVGFFQGNYLAPTLDLSLREDHVEHLVRIAHRLVEVFASDHPLPDGMTEAEMSNRSAEIAKEIGAADQSSGSRRTLVKRVCAYLLGIPEAPDASAAEF